MQEKTLLFANNSPLGIVFVFFVFASCAFVDHTLWEETTMRVLMTGANGMLGRDLCALLEQSGHTVVRTDRAAPPNETMPEWEPLDVTDTEAVSKCLNQHQPDAVVHAAACTDVDGCERDPERAYKLNALGTWNMAAICGNHNMTLAYISTDFVFDGTKTTPYNEFDKPNPLSHYGMSKYAGEKFVAQLCRRHFIVRTAWLFGIHGGKSFPDKILALAETNKERFVVTDQIGSPTHTVDLSRALIDLLDSPLYGTYHITNAGTMLVV